MPPQIRQPSDADHKAWSRVSDQQRERLREAVARLNRREERITIGAVQKISGVARGPCSLARRLYAANVLPDPGTPQKGVGAWARATLSGDEGDDAAPDLNAQRVAFSEEVLNASSDEERARLQHKLAALIALGVYGHQEANAIRQSLNTATAHNREARNAPGDEARESRVYAGPDSYALVRAFDGIVSDERRARILRFVADEFDADLAEHPPIDTTATEVPA